MSLSQNKLRTFLTAFGVFWGIFMLLTMLGGASGISNGARGQWGDFAVNSMFIQTGTTTYRLTSLGTCGTEAAGANPGFAVSRTLVAEAFDGVTP